MDALAYLSRGARYYVGPIEPRVTFPQKPSPRDPSAQKPQPRDWAYSYFEARLAAAIPPLSADEYAEDRLFNPSEAVDVTAVMTELRRAAHAESKSTSFHVAKRRRVSRRLLKRRAWPKRLVRLDELLRHDGPEFIEEAYRRQFGARSGCRRPRELSRASARW